MPTHELPPAGGVHLWWGRTDNAVAAHERTWLGEAERTRWARLPLRAREGFVVAHVLIRRILGDYLDVAPEALRFDRHPCPHCGSCSHGRPRVSPGGSGLEYSVSRSGSRWVLAVSPDVVGVDLETRRPVQLAALRAVALTPRERLVLGRCGDDDAREAVFFRCWTRKEAVVKATGAGIPKIGAVDVDPGRTSTVTVADPAGHRRWRVDSMGPMHGCDAALARPVGGTGLVVHRQWEPDADQNRVRAAAPRPTGHVTACPPSDRKGWSS